ncbi:MAG TPA: hypothetical protein VIG24_18205 [Acidimicrobiia bacterium]
MNFPVIRWVYCPDWQCRVVAEIIENTSTFLYAPDGPVPFVTVRCGAGHRYRLPLDTVIEMPD